MQFPRAPRFVEKAPSGVPGPGAYDPQSPKDDKKGLLHLVQSERFNSKENNNPSTFGMYTEKENQAPTNTRKRIASSSQTIDNAARERHKLQLEEMKTRWEKQHEKEVSKLQAKLAKYETTREELTKEKNESSKEVIGLKSEIRHLSTKLTKTESLLEKHQTSLPLLQSKLTSLQTSHEQSRQRKEAELSSLRAQLEQLETKYLIKLHDCREFEESAERERAGRTLQAQVAERIIEELKENVREARVVHLTRERLARVKVERQLQDRSAQVDSLVEYSRGLEETVERLKEQTRSLLEDNKTLAELWMSDRALSVNERSEKEWRQRARSDMRESAGLADELESARREAEMSSELEKTGDSVWKLRKREWREEKDRMSAEGAAIAQELNAAVNENIPQLEKQITSLTSRLEDQASHSATLESDLSNLIQESSDATERFEAEIEQQKRIVETKAKELDKERSDKRRVVGLLVQSRAAETALREQVEDLASQLHALAPLTSEHTSLQQTVDHLARINAATEQDLHDLIDQNAELAGHSNQNQKIKHVASLREELVESKRKHLSTISLLSATQNKVKSLEQELNSYRAVPTSSQALPPLPARSRVSRPDIADVVTTETGVMSRPQQQPLEVPNMQNIPTVITTSASTLPVVPRASNRPPRTFRSSVTPSTSTLSALVEDETLLPPILAKSASSFLTGPKPTSLTVRGVGTAEKMHGRMSVSELKKSLG